MKRIYTLIVLMGLVMGALVTGCNKEESTTTPPSTNAPATPTPPPATTNK